jgi:hypothetical protein
VAKYGLDPEAVVGQAFVLRGDELEKIDRMLTRVEVRRTAMMQGFNGYRATWPVGQIAAIEPQQVPLIPAS